MPNSYFRFKEFIIHQNACAMKVCTDSCLFGAWVADHLRKTQTETKSILDIGSGSGLLSLMLMQKLPSAIVDAVEIEPVCFAQSVYNIRQSPWHESILVHNSDIKTFTAQKRYDVIISNPPFYASHLASERLEKNIAHHDIALTLPSLIKVVKNNLTHDGCFAVLLPYFRAAEFENMMSEEGFFTNKKTLARQSDKHPLFRTMFLFSKGKSETREDEIVIKESNNMYSAEFISLLKDYYLHL